MARITVLGGTGYAGGNIVAVAAQRRHTVKSYSRKPPAQPVAGVDYRTGDVSDAATLADAFSQADVVVSALAPRGNMADGVVRQADAAAAKLAQAKGVRFGVIGGAGSLQVTAGGPTLAETPDFPNDYKSEAIEMTSVLDDLRASDPSLDWFFVSPAANFGAWVPGEATGKFRVGGDVLLVDDKGESNISGADLALAIVQEIETPQHRRARFTVSY